MPSLSRGENTVSSMAAHALKRVVKRRRDGQWRAPFAAKPGPMVCWVMSFDHGKDHPNGVAESCKVSSTPLAHWLTVKCEISRAGCATGNSTTVPGAG